MKHAVIAMGIGLVASGGLARADIVEWRDAAGVRHYTNNSEDVPPAAATRVIVTERPEAPEPAPRSPAPPLVAEQQAQVAYDTSAVLDAYLDGLQRGLNVARGSASPVIQVQGPLAIATANQVAPVDPTTPLVTTGFDRGRSRHLTIRMLLQDQFQLDRDGPFLAERFPPGGHINLRPFLPRGLPGRVPQGGRVLF
jgi:hypothetical protein